MKNQQYGMQVESSTYLWDVEKLMEKVDPSAEESVPLDFFDLDVWVWGTDKPQDHILRIFQADLSYPILVWDKQILDGYHRLIKAHLEGRSSIRVLKIKELPSPDDVVGIDGDYEDPSFTCRDILEIISLTKMCIEGYPNRHPIDGI